SGGVEGLARRAGREEGHQFLEEVLEHKNLGVRPGRLRKSCQTTFFAAGRNIDPIIRLAKRSPRPIFRKPPGDRRNLWTFVVRKQTIGWPIAPPSSACF